MAIRPSRDDTNVLFVHLANEVFVYIPNADKITLKTKKIAPQDQTIRVLHYHPHATCGGATGEGHNKTFNEVAIIL